MVVPEDNILIFANLETISKADLRKKQGRIPLK